jgi:hypothetical protein
MMLKHIAHARAERALAVASIEAKTVFSQYIIVYGVFTVLKNAHRMLMLGGQDSWDKTLPQPTTDQQYSTQTGEVLLQLGGWIF